MFNDKINHIEWQELDEIKDRITKGTADWEDFRRKRVILKRMENVQIEAINQAKSGEDEE